MLKKRNSAIELLRIIAMVLIILNHLAYYGGSFATAEGINYYLSHIFICGGKFGVAIFVLIGSFYMFKKAPSIKKAFSLWLKTFLISVSFGILGIFVNGFVLKEFIKSFLPFFVSVLWFVTEYIVLMVLSPFLNRFIASIDKKQSLLLVIVLTIICSLIPSIKLGEDIFLNELVWFLYLYLLVGILSKHTNIFLIKDNRKFLFLLSFFVTYSIMSILICVLGSDYLFLRSSGSLLVLASSFSLFSFFINLRERHSAVINVVANCTFMAYLLHDNSMRFYIWNNVFQTGKWISSNYYVLFSFSSVIIIFAVAIPVNFVVDKLIGVVLKIGILKNAFNRYDSFFIAPKEEYNV